MPPERREFVFFASSFSGVMDLIYIGFKEDSIGLSSTAHPR